MRTGDGATEWRFDELATPLPLLIPSSPVDILAMPSWLADSFRAVERAQLTVRSARDSVEHLALKLDRLRGRPTEEEPWQRAESAALRAWPALWRRHATFRVLTAECKELGEGTRLSRAARNDQTEGGTVALAAAAGEETSLTYGEVSAQYSVLDIACISKPFVVGLPLPINVFRSNLQFSSGCSCEMCFCA